MDQRPEDTVKQAILDLDHYLGFGDGGGLKFKVILQGDGGRFGAVAGV